MKKSLTLVLAGVTSMGLAFSAFADDYITLASTTSTQNSGLFNAILPQFEDTTGIDVRVVAVGTGQAFEIARRGVQVVAADTTQNFWEAALHFGRVLGPQPSYLAVASTFERVGVTHRLQFGPLQAAKMRDGAIA